MISSLKDLIRPFYLKIKQYQTEKEFRKNVINNKSKGVPLKIVVGSSGKYDKNWIPSEEYILNLLDEATWKVYFEENEINAILAEHVWEHLTTAQGELGAKVCYKYLKPGGYLRIAVPDGYHCNPEYIDYVKPGGSGAGAFDHKVLYNYETFSAIFRKAGFHINVLEYFDEQNQFHFNEWSIEQGKITRSIRYDQRNINGKPNYTSIIIDAIKQ